MKYYIQDSTIGNKVIYFNTVNEVVSYFNRLIPRAFGMNRNQYVQHLIDLGHGYDDPDGVILTEAIAERFNMGIVKNNGKHERTNIHQASKFVKEEYGD